MRCKLNSYYETNNLHTHTQDTHNDTILSLTVGPWKWQSTAETCSSEYCITAHVPYVQIVGFITWTMSRHTLLTWCTAFYVHVTVHRNKLLFNKTNRRTNFPNLFLSRNSTCFGQFLCPSSGVFHCTLGTGICHQTCMTYTSAECTVENSWWWAEELPETCRVSWQK